MAKPTRSSCNLLHNCQSDYPSVIIQIEYCGEVTESDEDSVL